MRPTSSTLKLPAALISELGGPDTLQRQKGSRTVPTVRKDRRKAERIQKKQRQVPSPAKRTKPVQILHPTSDFQGRHGDAPIDHQRVRAASELGPNKAPQPKSILKKTQKPSPTIQKEHSPPPKPSRLSQSLREKLAQDDAEIALLEKKLGLKGKKSLPQSFVDDGLDELLAGVDSLVGLDEGNNEDARGKKRHRKEEDDWLVQKRRKALAARVHDSTESEDDVSVDTDQLLDGNSDLDEHDEDSMFHSSETGSEGGNGDKTNDDEDDDTEAEFGGFDSDTPDRLATKTRVRENPYVAPTTIGASGVAKYVPPSLRKAPSSDSEDVVRLRRQTQGLVNRLTESNLVSILGDIEQLYRTNARQHVTSTLVDLLLISVCEPTALPDTLIILPAGFIAAVYKIIGTDFGAHIVQRIVELFDSHYKQACHNLTNNSNSDNSKETSNLMNLLSELYNFQVVGSTLLFDYIRLFLTTLSELNAELLLKIIRTSGPQLRQEDPSSLRDIVSMIRPAVAQIGEANISVRTKFMIETINDLKNNKIKTGAAASAVVSEHTVRMKKILGSLNNRNIKGSEPLRVGLKDIQHSDKKGKWWLVGASWAGNGRETRQADDAMIQNTGNAKDDTGMLQAIDPGSADLVQLAREQRMNTDIRRAIFITIMSASDFQDAYMRLLRLKLKKVQELEIPKVLIHCTGAEASYNPYYTLIAKKLCGNRKLKMAFQFSLWDLFKRMGETDDEAADAEDLDDDDALDTRHVVNLAKMYGNLIADGGLTLGVLKNLNMSYLQPKTKSFLEILLITVFLQSQRQVENKGDEQAVTNLIEIIGSTPSLIRGLQFFIREVVAKTDVAGGKEERATVKWACKVAIRVLDRLAMES